MSTLPAIAGLVAQHFSAHLGCTAWLVATGQPMAVHLVEVRELGPSSAGARRVPFSVLFEGADDRVVEQGTHRVELVGCEPLDLFLVPIGPGPSGRPRYEAIFT